MLFIISSICLSTIRKEESILVLYPRLPCRDVLVIILLLLSNLKIVHRYFVANKFRSMKTLPFPSVKYITLV